MNIKKCRFILITCALVILFGIPLFIFIHHVNQMETERSDYTKKTSPLSDDVIIDICTKFGLPEHDKRCSGGIIVYAPEFFEDIVDHINNLPEDNSNRKEIDDLLGNYLIECDPMEHTYLGENLYRCLYDLQGDHVSIIQIWFTEQDDIESVLATSGGS